MTALYGYVALFIGMLIEGELALLATAFAVHQVPMTIPLIILVATVAIQLTDWFHFWVGRFAAVKFLTKRPGLSRRVKRVSTWINRYPNLFLIIYRYIYGFRTVLPIAIGLSEISIYRFAIFSLISAIIWATSYTLLGYYLGETIIKHIAFVKQYEWYIIIGIILLIILLFLGRQAYRWHRGQKIKRLREEHRRSLEQQVL